MRAQMSTTFDIIKHPRRYGVIQVVAFLSHAQFQVNKNCWVHFIFFSNAYTNIFTDTNCMRTDTCGCVYILPESALMEELLITEEINVSI